MAAMTPRHRADPRRELGHLEGLGQIIIGAAVEAEDPGLGRIARGDHDHRCRVATPAQLPQQRDPVDLGRDQA